MKPLETFSLATGVVEIHLDPHPKSPLEATIRLGRMVFWTTKSRFREFVPSLSEDEFLLHEMARRELALHSNPVDLEKITKAQLVAYFRENHCIVQIHASGQFLGIQQKAHPYRIQEPMGISICSLEDAQLAFSAPPILGWESPVHFQGATNSLRQATLSTLQAEICEYNAYISGEVYGFRAFTTLPDGSLRLTTEQWGFYGAEGRRQALRDACKVIGADVPLRMAA